GCSILRIPLLTPPAMLWVARSCKSRDFEKRSVMGAGTRLSRSGKRGNLSPTSPRNGCCPVSRRGDDSGFVMLTAFLPTKSPARPMVRLLPIVFLLAIAYGAFGEAGEHLPSGPWADWVEPDFPFFSSVLDARKAGDPSPANNLTPRGIILNL